MNNIDEYEAKLKQETKFAFYDGKGIALREASDTMKRRSGVSFANGLDEEAKLLREIAIWLLQLSCDADKERARYMDTFGGGGV